MLSRTTPEKIVEHAKALEVLPYLTEIVYAKIHEIFAYAE